MAINPEFYILFLANHFADLTLECCLRSGKYSRMDLSAAACYSVNVYTYHLKELMDLGRVDVIDEGIYILNHAGSYSQACEMKSCVSLVPREPAKLVSRLALGTL